MATPIGGLLVELAANTAAFQADMGKAVAILNSSSAQMNRSLAMIDRGFAKVSRAAGVFGIGLGAGALLAFGRAALDSAGGLGELAEQLGVSTDNLQAYQFAAAQAGVRSTELQTGLSQLTRRMGEARDGSAEAVSIFRALGSEVEGLVASGASTDTVFRAIAHRISMTADAAKRGSLAYDVFGKSGQKLLPILSGGAEGLDELMRQARASGQVLDRELIDRFEKASDRIAVWQRSLTIHVADALDKSAAVLRDPKYGTLIALLTGAAVGGRVGGVPGAIGGGAVAGIIALNESAKAAFTEVERLEGELRGLNATIGLLEKNAAGAPALAQLRAEAAALRAQIDDLKRKADAAKWRDVDLEGRRGLALTPSAAPNFVLPLVSTQEKALVANLQKQVDLFGASEAAALRYRLEKEKDAAGNPKYSQTVIEQAVALQRKIDALKSVTEMQERAAQADLELQDEANEATNNYMKALAARQETFDQADREIEANKQLAAALGQGTAAYERQAEVLRILGPLREAGIDPTEAEVTRAKRQAAVLVDQNRAIDRQQALLGDLENFGERSFDRLGQAAVLFGEKSKAAFADLRNVGAALVFELQEMFLKLALLNPIKNALFGGSPKSPTLATAGGFLGAGVSRLFESLFTSNAATNGASLFVSNFATSSGFSSLQMGFADGTPSAPRGLAMVGEEGPELVNFRGGERVFDHGTSMDMLGGGGPTIYADLRGASVDAVMRLEKMVRDLNGSIEPRAVNAVALAKARGVPGLR